MLKNKILTSLFIFGFLVPQITFASWWNPITWMWFKPKVVTEQQIVKKDIRKEFVKIGGEYSAIFPSSAFSINDKLVFEAKNEGDSFIIYDGVELGKEYELVGSPKSINGRLAYFARRDGKSFIVYDGKEIGKEYDGVSDFGEVGGKLLYTAYKITGQNRVKNYIIFDGKVFGEENGFFSTSISLDKKDYFNVVNGKLAYMANENHQNKWFIVYDGVKLGKQYDEITIPEEINGKLTYMANKDGKNFIVYGGEEIGKEYDRADYPIEVNGKLSYFAKKDKKTFVVYDGKKIGNEYSGDYFVQSPKEIDGKLAYKIGLFGAIKSFVVYDGKEYGKEYDSIDGDLMSVNDKLLYKVKKDGKNFTVYDGKEIGKQYDGISNIVSVNGKLAYLTAKNDNFYINYDGTEYEFSFKEYSNLGSLVVLKGKLAFSIEKDNKSFFMLER
jgi:hypothetical protein